MDDDELNAWSDEVENNTRRMGQVNRYYELKYNTYKNIGIEVILVLIVIIIVNILGNIIPENFEKYTIFVTIILAVGIICRTASKLYDVFIRSNRKFQEYDFGDPNDNYRKELSNNDYYTKNTAPLSSMTNIKQPVAGD
jgi:hypothetical protein